MKKLIAITLAVVMLLTLGVTPVFAAKPGTDFNGPHYNLNLIGKNKVMPGDYDNPDRHTMFVPVDTSDFNIPLETPNNLNQSSLPGIKINMTQGSEFAVLDGNATDGEGSFQLGAGKYHVYIAVKAKSPKFENPYTDITGWVEAYDNTGALWYYIDIGSVTVRKGNNSWTDATGLFFVTAGEDDFGFVTGSEADYIEGLGIWVFDYMAGLDAWTTGGYDLDQLAYFWQFDNHGNKLIQVRFYSM
jgi:hypothetical protein